MGIAVELLNNGKGGTFERIFEIRTAAWAGSFEFLSFCDFEVNSLLLHIQKRHEKPRVISAELSTSSSFLKPCVIDKWPT